MERRAVGHTASEMKENEQRQKMGPGLSTKSIFVNSV